MQSSLNFHLLNDPMLTSLDAKASEALIGVATLKQVKKGQVIHRKGDAPTGLIRVISGRIKARATDFSGAELLLTTISPGDWFGEISILDGMPRTHDAIAIDDCVYALFPTDVVRRVASQYTAVNAVMVHMLCAHIRGAFSALDDFLSLSPERRLAKRVLEMHVKQSGSSVIRMSQQDLSDLIGLSRQSINKILKRWEQDGLVSRHYRGFTIINVTGLQQLVVP